MTVIERAEAVAYRASIREDLASVTRWLLENVGQRITTVAAGLNDASMLRAYARSESRPTEDRESRLRLLFRVARIIVDSFDSETARAFFVSSNPQLGERSPLTVIRDDDPKQAAQELLGAARALLEG